MSEKFSRRRVLGLGAAAGAALLGTHGCTSTGSRKMAVDGAVFPWPYLELDAEQTRQRAYEKYFEGGCMYGVFEAVAAQVAEKLGEPYTDFPFRITTYGGGGVALWGTLCGTCNGAAMTASLFAEAEERNRIIGEIFTWYEETELPIFKPRKPLKVSDDFEMPTSRARSTLCHLSITRWTKTSGYRSFDPQRLERCARLVADMAGCCVELLNRRARGAFKAEKGMGETASHCLECHAEGNQAPNEPEVVSKMHCTTCHPQAHNQPE
jgi:hypothetical protein